VFPPEFFPTVLTFGIGRGTGPGPEPRGQIRLPVSYWNALVPADLPATIRVARYTTAPTSCSGSIYRIDTLDFEDYVQGVVNAEVGVFHGVEGGSEAAAECWKAFAVAARSYALHFFLSQPYDGYDINDTACNQAYSDDRDAEVSAAAQATAGQILVKASDPDVIDRYFYAASCAEHGTEPAYRQGMILPDPTPVRACVGSWCGHDNCAGHADNPDVPGSDRCLVWGTCQWGSVERSMAGDGYRDILAHYQPECLLRDLSNPDPDDGGTDAGGDGGLGDGGCGCSGAGGTGAGLVVIVLILVGLVTLGRQRHE
jgi:MYXO-CTERM domain-containing protein